MSKSFSIYLFIVGFVMLSVEIAAMRLFAPYFGSSVYATSVIIGVVLLALAFGYFIGGRLADKQTITIKHVVIATAICSFWISSIPIVSEILLPTLVQNSTGYLGLYINAAWASLLLLGAPSVILSSISPVLLKKQTEQLTELGRNSGLISSLVTFGNIVGTLTTPFILISYLGVFASFQLLAGLLAISTILLLSSKKLSIGVVLLIVYLLLLSQYYQPFINKQANAFFVKESPYQQIKVQMINGRKAIKTQRGVGIQSLEPDMYGINQSYTDYLAFTPAFSQKDQYQVLVIGLAGGVVTGQMSTIFPDDQLQFDAVEIDPVMVEVAKEYFQLNESVRVHIQDGRTYLSQSKQKYDIVLIDAFGNEGYIPFHLATKEFFLQVQEDLNLDGIIAMNIIGSPPPANIQDYISSTAAAVFPEVFLFEVGGKQGAEKGNYILFASNKEFEIFRDELGRYQYLADALATRMKMVEYDNKLLFTDDKAPTIWHSPIY